MICMTTLPPEQRTIVLATKLAMPRLPSTLVARDRLVGALNGAFLHRLTVVSASAGWGKTTLLASWLRQQGSGIRGKGSETASFPDPRPLIPDPSFAWLSLDELDNDPFRFWVALVAALRTHLPDIGALALGMLQSPEQPPLTTVLTTVLNELASAPESTPLVMIVDDYHLLTDGAIHESVAFFVEHLPNHVHLVLATRVDPDLPLARWRVRGELLEVRAADLRFSQTEAERFFARTLGDVLDIPDVERLQQRTEGWVAGLQLAALALRHRENPSAFVRSFAGTHHYLLDYVQTEILAQQEPNIQRFLLYTAVLRRMNAALCTAVTHMSDSQAILETLERSNLFVVPLDDERRWYRMHDLFREVLLVRLQATEPTLVPQLQAHAARWHAMHHDMREAIEYALAAQDWGFAAQCIEQVAAEMLRRGEAKLVLDWISSMPDSVLQQHARLALDAALPLLEANNLARSEAYRRTRTAVERTLARVEAMPADLPEVETALLQRRIRLLRALLVTRSLLADGDQEGMRRLAEETATLAQGDNIRWQLVPLGIACSYTLSMLRDGALLLPRLREAKQQALATGDHSSIIRVTRWLAFAYLYAGEFRLLEQECREALALIEAAGELSATGYFRFYLTHVYYASNRLAEALGAGREVLRVARLLQNVDLLHAANDTLARVALASGDHATAKEALAELEEIARRESPIHAGLVSGTQAEFWLATGNLDAARNWAGQQVFSPETWHANHQWGLLQVVRVLLADSQHTQALGLLQMFSAHLDRPGDIPTTMRFLALHVVALQATGQGEQAQAVVMRLLDLTAPENNIRVFLDAGEPMRRMLQQLHDAALDDQDELSPTLRAFSVKLLHAFESEPQRDTPPAPHVALHGADALAEPLTGREQDVLRLLVDGASNNEIASTLVISLATAKKHVSSILTKFGVTSRAQAVARAREREW